VVWKILPTLSSVVLIRLTSCGWALWFGVPIRGSLLLIILYPFIFIHRFGNWAIRFYRRQYQQEPCEWVHDIITFDLPAGFFFPIANMQGFTVDCISSTAAIFLKIIGYCALQASVGGRS
jgi:hypothetical protein